MQSQEKPKYIYGVSVGSERIFMHGIGGKVVETLHEGDVFLLLSDVPEGPLLTREHMLEHEQVIETSRLEYGSILPMRFGTIVQTSGDAKKILTDRKEEFKTLLVSLAGKEEINISATWKNFNTMMSQKLRGNNELQQLKGMLKSAVSMQEKIHIGEKIYEIIQNERTKKKNTLLEFVAGLYETYEELPIISEEMIYRVSFLLSQEDEQTFLEKMKKMKEESNRSGIMFSCNGPYTPYHFISYRV